MITTYSLDSSKYVCQFQRFLNENIAMFSKTNDLLKFNVLISGHPGGLTPGTYGGIARDLLTFVANFWPGTGALSRFRTSKARYTEKNPRDL